MSFTASEKLQAKACGLGLGRLAHSTAESAVCSKHAMNMQIFFRSGGTSLEIRDIGVPW